MRLPKATQRATRWFESKAAHHSKLPQGTLREFRVVKGVGLDLAIDIVLPNLVHGSRKKDL